MTLLAALRRRPRPAPSLAVFQRPAGPPPPVVVNVASPALTEAEVAGLRQRLADAVRGYHREPAEPLGYAVALLGADGRCVGTTHTTALDRDEAVREATACNRSQGTTGRYVAVEIRHLGTATGPP